MWTFEVNCVTQNNRSSKLRTVVSNMMHVLYDCSELHDQCQTSTNILLYATNAS